MNIFSLIFNKVLYQPILNGLILLYQYIPGQDFGLAVIILTILIRLILYPLMSQSLRSQKALNELQPKLQEIQKKYKDEPEKQAQELLKIYKKEKINPWGSFLPLLIQLPIIIALYQVFLSFKDGLTANHLSLLYSFVPAPDLLKQPMFLGFVNLGRPSLAFAVSAGICQFIQSKIAASQQKSQNQSKSDKENRMAQFSNIIQKETLYFFPVLTVFILWQLPAAIGLYWISTSLFSIFQQYLIFNSQKKCLAQKT